MDAELQSCLEEFENEVRAFNKEMEYYSQSPKRETLAHYKTGSMTKKEALEIIGNLSDTSKMPCKSYSIPASRCKLGKILSKAKGSICNDCYANKGFYFAPWVQKALERRYESLKHPQWTDAMVTAIGKDDYFRWHDSGDLQGIEHLDRICEVAKRTPNTKHWLPTREYGIVKEYIESGHEIPDNLRIRLSATMFDGKPPVSLAKKLGLNVSGASATNYNCPASKQGNKCGDCRACWDKDVFNVVYKKH